MPDCWYRYSAMRPPPTVQVLVIWQGRQFIAARAQHPDTGKVTWAEYKLKSNGKPSADATPVRMEGEPDLWRPLHPELWKAPLPEPIKIVEPRFVSERTRFALVEEAEAADLAQEMEANRESARAAGEPAEGRRVDVQWWRDATEIVYERPPNITLRMVEARLMRAVACCSDPKRVGDLHISQISEAAAQALAEIEATSSPDSIPPFKPLPADKDDFLVAMAWFTALYPPEARPPNWHKLNGMGRFNRAQKIIIWRAKNIPLSFDEIGAEFNVCERRVRQIFATAKEDAWRFANGMPPRKGLVKRIDHMRRTGGRRLWT